MCNSDDPRSGSPSCSRRSFLQIAITTGIAITAAPPVAADSSAESSAPPKAGDHLVFAEGERTGQEIKPEDLVLGEQQTMAWPMDPVSKVVHDGSRLNEIIVLRLDPG